MTSVSMSTMKVLGLDVSTSVVGVSIVDGTAAVVTPVLLEHVDLGKCENFWQKVDVITAYLKVLKTRDEALNIVHVGVEEALMSFRPGASSAQTITTLIAFNAVVRHVLRQEFLMDPHLVPAATARKKAGVKVLSKKKTGKPVKDQVFDHMCKNDLSHITWPLKKPTKKNPEPSVKDWAKDVTDAYVIAKATLLLNS